MIRDGTAANAANAFVCVTPSNGVQFQWRTSAGVTTQGAGVGGITTPRHLRLVRSGNTFTASYSSDGSSWTQIGSPQTINMPSGTRAGLAVTSHNNGTSAGGIFDNFSLTTGGTTPPPPPPPSGGTGTGLRGEYFNNKTLTGTAALTRTDSTVNFAWTGSPGTGVNADNFSVRWTGQVEAPTTGSYTFQTVSDDGVRVWLTNGSETQVINNWTDHAPTTNNSSAVSLTGGTKYTIRMEFYEATGGAEARLRWQTPGSTSFVAVPQGRLYPANGTTPPPPPPPPPSGSGPVADGVYLIKARHSGKALDLTAGNQANGTQLQQWAADPNNANQRWRLTRQSDGSYEVALASNAAKVVDANQSSTANGTKVQLWDDNNSNAQRWVLVATDSGYYQVQSKLASTAVWDVSNVSTSDGAKIHLWTWSNTTNQQWNFTAAP